MSVQTSKAIKAQDKFLSATRSVGITPAYLLRLFFATRFRFNFVYFALPSGFDVLNQVVGNFWSAVSTATDDAQTQ